MNDAINSAISALWERIQDSFIETVSETIKNTIKKFSEGFKKENQNIISESIENLNKTNLVEIATKYKVEGSTEVAAYKVATDDEYIIYLAYTNNRELLDAEVNNYIIIRTQSLTRDVEKLFSDDKLILLK